MMIGGAWEPDETSPGNGHPFATALGEALERNDAAPLVAALRKHFGCEVHPTIVAYVEASLRAARLPGPLRIEGVARALARPMTCQQAFGAFGDRPFPAIAIGGSGGVTFWASVETGRVITLHHDATFFEVGAKSAGADVDSSMRAFEARGSVLSVEELLALQTSLHRTLGEKRASGPELAAAVIAALKATKSKARRMFETTPWEFLGLRANDVDDIPAKKKPLKDKATARHPWIDDLSAKSLDLSYATLDRLPSEVLEMRELETLDLSYNHHLDFDEVFTALKALPALKELHFHNAGIDELPDSFAELTSLERVDLVGAGGRRAALETGRALDVVTRLPNVRALDLLGCIDRSGRAGELLEKLVSIEELSFNQHAVAKTPPAMPSLRTLRWYGKPFDVAQAPNVESLTLGWVNQVDLASLTKLPLRRLVLDHLHDVVVPEGLVHLEELEISFCKRVRLPSFTGCERLRSIEITWSDELGPIPDLRGLPSLSSLKIVRSSHAPVAGPLENLEVLELASMPEWIEGCPRLRSLSFLGAKDPADAMSRAIALPTLESIDASMFGTPFTLPDRFGDTKLKSIRITGDFEDDVVALARIAESPLLEELAIFSYDVADLPEALESRPLKRFHHYVSTKGVQLDLARAFRRLAKTPLEEMQLQVFTSAPLPQEIASIGSLVRLALNDHVPPKVPDAIASLENLRQLSWRELKLSNPERKRLQRLLPKCRLKDDQR